MGAVYPAICGQVLVGQTNVGTWRTTWVEPEPKLVLKPRTFSITITEGPLITLIVNRPRLILNARPLQKQTSTSPALGMPMLTLRGKPYVIQPFLRAVLARPTLLLRGRNYVIARSASLAFGKPLLILNAKKLVRVGMAVLIPSDPIDFDGLTPTHPGSADLIPTAAGSANLIATPMNPTDLIPTAAIDGAGLLVPTEVIVR